MKNSESMKRLNTLKQIRLGLAAAGVVLMVLFAALALMKPEGGEAGSSGSAPADPETAQSASLPEQPDESDDALLPELPDDIQNGIRPPEEAGKPIVPFKPDVPDSGRDSGQVSVPEPQPPRPVYPADQHGEVTVLSARPSEHPNPNAPDLLPDTPGSGSEDKRTESSSSVPEAEEPATEQTGRGSGRTIAMAVTAVLLVLDLGALVWVSRKIRSGENSLDRREERRTALPTAETKERQPMKTPAPGPVEVGNLHQIGARPYQEDCSGFNRLRDGVLAIVADGMGGLESSEKVSQKIVYTMLGYSQKLGPGQMDGVLGRMILSVSDEVDRMLGPEGRAKSGSTVVTALIRQGCFHWAAVGDSHVYLYRNGKLLQLNQEHNRGQDMLVKAAREGLSFDEVRREKKKSGLTSFLGMGRLRHLEQSLRSIPLQGGDRIVLSTDGVFDVLSDAAIAEVLRRNPDVQQAADQLGRQVAACRNPQQDNYTAIILGV